MDRRTFVKAAAGTAIVGAGGLTWLLTSNAAQHLTIERALERLAALQGKQLVSAADWSPSVIFQHCAQSVMCSMAGYPDHKPEWFKQSLGPLALEVFAAAGALHHNTADPVPGMPALEDTLDDQEALQALAVSYRAFASFDEALHDHFAYGALNKKDYEAAHVMHLFDHLDDVHVS